MKYAVLASEGLGLFSGGLRGHQLIGDKTVDGADSGNEQVMRMTAISSALHHVLLAVMVRVCTGGCLVFVDTAQPGERADLASCWR